MRVTCDVILKLKLATFIKITKSYLLKLSLCPESNTRDRSSVKTIILLWSCDSPQPVAFAGIGVAADGVILIGQPDDEDDVEGCRRVVEELRHDGLHA